MTGDPDPVVAIRVKTPVDSIDPMGAHSLESPGHLPDMWNIPAVRHAGAVSIQPVRVSGK